MPMFKSQAWWHPPVLPVLGEKGGKQEAPWSLLVSHPRPVSKLQVSAKDPVSEKQNGWLLGSNTQV